MNQNDSFQTLNQELDQAGQMFLGKTEDMVALDNDSHSLEAEGFILDQDITKIEQETIENVEKALKNLIK